MIETERLRLRPFTDADRDTVARWNADPVLTRHLAGVQTREQSDAAVECRDSNSAGYLTEQHFLGHRRDDLTIGVAD